MPPPSRKAARDDAVLAAIRDQVAPHAAAQIPLPVIAAAVHASVDTVRRSVRRLVDADRLEVSEQQTPWGGDAPMRFRPAPDQVTTEREPIADQLKPGPVRPAATRHAGQTVRSRSVESGVAPPVDVCAR